jgi:lipopolysaccharide biosynthesis glycosyltransferase
MVPEDVKKLLYVDTDIVCVNDLAPLFSTSLEGYPVGAIYDKGVKTAPRIGITEEGNYFNSGVLLINVPVWNEQKISEQVLQFVADHAETIIYPDQDGLNAVLKGRWKKLDWRYNVMHMYIPPAMSSKEKRSFLADKVLLHYTLDRPWKMLCQSQFRGLYHKYLKASPFEVKDKYVDYSIKKLPHFLKIRAAEVYFDMPIVKKLWRRVRQRN